MWETLFRRQRKPLGQPLPLGLAEPQIHRLQLLCGAEPSLCRQRFRCQRRACGALLPVQGGGHAAGDAEGLKMLV